MLAVLTVLLRLPFLDAPITADEGGYAEIARLWAHGQGLYRTVWVDRPQGLLLVYRGLLDAGLGSTVDFRLAAAGFAALLVILAVALGMRTGGRIPALIAGVLVATAGASPFIESFTLSASCSRSAALVVVEQPSALVDPLRANGTPASSRLSAARARRWSRGVAAAA